ncbi:class I SAM-dependent methyltransferase [Propylenella binzhouense]|uniref:Class I SAM-dependent methyltransferase n=1 Tax=Propylenella binzhouense TaxID=2555902 RepID=A0A964WRZ1_9HYPH|nr:class I SAM-dependent methyltransferase [Propylenella binzhouense]MYZ46311.1 class I SAM-dependent methyltransferase [Propylenella binzhouense]
MGVYARWVLPLLIDWTMRDEDLAAYRRRLAPRARGFVLEVGVGSGLNLPLYGPAVERVIGLDPSFELLARAAARACGAALPVHLVRASAEAMPLRDASVDTVLMTWTLCSIADARAGLREMRRVLRPGGELLFVEHGLAPERQVAAWQRRLDPLWSRISCHLDNPVDRLLREAGFSIERLNTGYLGKGPKPLTFMYEGCARAT